MPQLQDSAGSGRRLADGYRSTRNKLQGSKELFESIWPIFYPENFDRTLWPATWNHFFYEKSIINAEMQKKRILNAIMCIAPISYNDYISDIIIWISESQHIISDKMGGTKKSPFRPVKRKRDSGAFKTPPKKRRSGRSRAEEHELRMRIVIMSKDGIAFAKIATELQCDWTTVVCRDCRLYWQYLFDFHEKKWADRAEEVFETGKVHDAPRSGQPLKLGTKKKQQTIYNKLKKGVSFFTL